MKKIIWALMGAVMVLTGCIEDGFDTSASAQPQFSVEELDMGIQFAENPSPTAKLTIHNPNSKQINLSSVRMQQGDYFRINVDGMTGRQFRDVEIRPNDSIYVFVECTVPVTPSKEPVVMEDGLEVITNGVTKVLPVKATAQNVTRHKAEEISGRVSWSADVPHLITDTLRVLPGSTLTLEAGARLLFHDKSALVVEGTLLAQGTAEAPVTMNGDRTGNVVADISYDVMSNQWEGVIFRSTSKDNKLEYTDIANTCNGVALDSLVDLTLTNCRITNSGGILLEARGANRVTALGTELSNARSALTMVGSGEYLFDRCTLANWYLFKWPDMSIIEFSDPDRTKAEWNNCVIYGRDSAIGAYIAQDKIVTDYDIWFRRCIFQVEGYDDERYLNNIWQTDPLLDYSLTEYTFPYTPLPDSPALNAAMAEYDSPLLPATDRRGLTRTQTIGAYEPLPATED